MSGRRREFHLRHLAARPHAVYIVWGGDQGDEALYVGMTSNWTSRVGHHLKRFDPELTHIDVWEAAESRDEAQVIERDVIRALRPQHNHEHTDLDEYRDRRLTAPAEADERDRAS